MKFKSLFIILFILLTGISSIYIGRAHSFNPLCKKQVDNTLQSGDIFFQTSQSAQCTAVQLATHSIYSHCGILFKQGNNIIVYEAVQPVKTIPLKELIKEGKDNKYVIKRLKNAKQLLTSAVLEKMKKVADQYKGKNYDIYFGWSDDRIYCSELVWKIYKQGADIEVGKLEQLKDFDLTSEPVKKLMKERYGNNIPYKETVISPVSIFKSELLVTVEEK